MGRSKKSGLVQNYRMPQSIRPIFYMSCSPCACIFGATCIFISSLTSSCIGHSSCNVVHPMTKAAETMASSFSSSMKSRLRPGIQAGSQQSGFQFYHPHPFRSILTCGLDLAASETQGWSTPGGTKLAFGPLGFRLWNSDQKTWRTCGPKAPCLSENASPTLWHNTSRQFVSAWSAEAEGRIL